MTLKELGKKHGTDKYTHGFLDTYEMYLSRIKEVKNVLEIGVRSGASLRMWEEYFPSAIICGLDINPECEKHESERIEVYIGDQTDVVILDRLWSEYDLIIDDGSHVNEWTVKTFVYLFPRLTKGGVYILEDMQCSYQDLEKVDVRNKWSGMKLVPEIPKQERRTIDELLAQLSHRVDRGEIEAVHVHKNFILVVK